MAEVITRFKLETTQYDSKLRDASKALADYTKQASIAGNEFGKFTQANVEAARAFGSIATSATNSKDKVKELVSAFNDVARQYNALTKEQQQSDFGKALAESMTTLKGRISEAKAEMNSTGGILGQLKDKFTVNIDALKLFQMGLSATKASLDVAKDAFFANEQNLDEWGQIVESSESLYKGFLDALNTGDISGYLQNIDDITKAARAAYNALDALNTFNAFNQINVEKTRTGMTEAIADYRGGTGSKDAVKAAGEAYKKELQERKKLEKEAYIAAVGEVAAQRGVSKEDLLTALSGTYGSYQQLKNMPMSGTQTVFYGGGMFGGGGSYQKEVPNSIQEKLGYALRRLNDDELKNLQALGAQAERTGNEIATVDKQLTRVLNGRGGSGGGGGGRSGDTYIPLAGSIDDQTAKVQELQKAWRAAADDDSRQKIKKEIEEQQHILDYMTGKISAPGKMAVAQGITPTSGTGNPLEIYKDAAIQLKTPLQALEEELKNIRALQEAAWSPEVFAAYEQRAQDVQGKIDAFKGIKKDADASAKSFQAAAGAISTVGSALSSIEDPSAKIFGIVAQAIATIANAFASALGSDTTTKGNIWAFIGASAASMTAMAAAIAQIHSATGYASGGVIKGNSYSGDNIGGLVDGSQFVGLNAGEVVLNRAQAGVLAESLQNNNGGGGGYTPSHVSGEQIWIALNRYTRRTGMGELMTWK